MRHSVVRRLDEGTGMAKKKRSKSRPDEPRRLTQEELEQISTRDGLIALLEEKEFDLEAARERLRYERELEALQIELGKLQRTVRDSGRRVAILFEGRDAAGKGGSIRRFIKYMNPRTARVVALSKPSDVERGQWYFRRYVKALPNPGEICFFDRSWYNRAVVEPVMDFCDEDQYRRFLRQVPEFEHMLFEDGIELVKFWFAITKPEQARRFAARRENPLKQWKISPVDERAQELWDDYSRHRDRMFARTHTTYAPWTIVRADVKRRARLESIRWVLSRLEYDGKDDPGVNIQPDPDVAYRYHRSQGHHD